MNDIIGRECGSGKGCQEDALQICRRIAEACSISQAVELESIGSGPGAAILIAARAGAAGGVELLTERDACSRLGRRW